MPNKEVLAPRELGELVYRYQKLRRELAVNGRCYVSHSWHESKIRQQMETLKNDGERERLQQHREIHLGCMRYISGCEDEIRRQCTEIVEQLGGYAPFLHLAQMRFNEYGERIDTLA